ncbi:FtsW/RodA/SpoVE family cell cycle protein [Lentzea sp. NPDC004789]
MDASGGVRRGVELLMLVFAALIVTAAFVLVEINTHHPLTMTAVWLGLAFLAVFGVAHLAVRRWAPYADPLILPCVALLNGLGLVMIYRLDLAPDVTEPAAPRQVAWTAVALVFFLVVLAVLKDHRVLAKYGYTCGLAGLVALILPGVLPSSISEVQGAKVWVRVGGLSIQPGEFAKILLIVFFAAFLVAKRELFVVAGRRVAGVQLPRLRDLGPLLAAWGVSIGVLALEKELGASLLFFGIVLAMLYVATGRIGWVAVGMVLFSVGCVVAYHLFSHVRVRVTNWVDPFADYYGKGYQMARAIFALAAGGISGTGLGVGHPDLVPEANTDFITVAFGEELGLIGLSALLLTYLLLAILGMRSALTVRDNFGKLLAGGLSFTIILQVFVVVGGATKFIPETGITAPFLSKGGSSLLANYMLVALLLRVSDAARRPAVAVQAPPPRIPLAGAETVMVRTTS